MPSNPQSPTFDGALRAAFVHLHRRLGFMLWTAIRFDCGHATALQTRDHGYGLPEDQLLRWVTPFAQRIIVAHGTRVAPRLDLLPDAADLMPAAPIRIGACAGAPLVLEGGFPFGAICAIHPSPLPDAIILEQPALELLAQMLSTIWQAESRVAETARLAERAQAEAHIDPLTGLRNRRAWDLLLETEEDRCRRYGHPACVFVIDVDDLKRVNDTLGHAAGDELLRRTARALQAAARNPDVVSRVGGDEFALLAIECDLGAIPSLLSRLEEVLALENVQASIGFAMRNSSLGLTEAWLEADHSMYREKRGRVKLRSQLRPEASDNTDTVREWSRNPGEVLASSPLDRMSGNDKSAEFALPLETQTTMSKGAPSVGGNTSPTTVAIDEPAFRS